MAYLGNDAGTTSTDVHDEDYGTPCCYTVYTDPYQKSHQFRNDIEKWLKQLENMVQILNAQWIHRIGFRLRFDPPKLILARNRVVVRKMLRCNRKGIGLRR